MAASDKTTIYVDVDDEITAIIDKVKQAPGKIVALVLPKRATVLQSIVNMKLLKKSAVTAKKSLVLITSEAGLMPLAGVVGLHVAKSLQSKPAIPPMPDDRSAAEPEEVVGEDIEPEEPEIDDQQSIGELAGMKEEEVTETIELDNTEDEPQPKDKKKASAALAKKFRVPDFDKFRTIFFLSILGVIVLIVGWIFAFMVTPKAKITIKTDSTAVPSTMSITASTSATTLDVDGHIVPAVSKEVKKTDTEKTTASGKKDVGTKATGSVTVRNCDYSDGFTIPAGSTFTTGGKSYVSTEAVTVPKFSGNSSSCSLSGSSSGKATVNVSAQSAGDSYNIAAAQYSVPGIPSSAKVDAIGSAMSGGTSKVVTVVNQSDVDAAAAKMKGRLDQEGETELTALMVNDQLYGLTETKVVSEPKITSSPAVGQEASGEVVVTSETTYTVLGVKKSDLSALVKKDVEAKIDTAKQSILDDGMDEAVARLEARKDANEATLNFQTIATAGPKLDENAIKESVRGKKKGQVQNEIGSIPGVKEVEVDYSPFWIYKTPKASKKITVIIEKPEATTESTTENNNGTTTQQ